ncbi:hypothetical protein [Psychromonas ossibalaenae]|uniref:hypothetical protein n=1 Tax=Psychromonas ossibalaenae TaxID=444922 RepID=UPI00035E39DC|nr:hypothetical protein [Psychromonas ossibalaenae]
MSKKPDRKTAMLHIIEMVKDDFPFDDPDRQICGTSCVGCPKKLLELIETEIMHWESVIDRGEVPDFGEISRFAKLCKNVRRGLVRNGLVEKEAAPLRN